jgi:hypothetical protein
MQAQARSKLLEALVIVSPRYLGQQADERLVGAGSSSLRGGGLWWWWYFVGRDRV